MGFLPAALLAARHALFNPHPYHAATTAGQIAYWVGFVAPIPLLFVVVAIVRNAFVPKDTASESKVGGFRNFFWPTNLKREPRGVARFGRVLHWLFVLVALAFVVSGVLATFNSYNSLDTVLALIFAGGGICFFAGRALRYIFAGE